MANKNNEGIIAIVVLLVVAGFFLQSSPGLFSITGDEVIERTTSSNSVNVGSTFQVIYTASSTSGAWGASIIDTVTGGCKFPDGSNQLKTVMLSTDGNSKTITVTTPSSQGSCSFSGDYQFGSESIKDFNDKTVTILTSGGDSGDDDNGDDNGGDNGEGSGSADEEVPSLDFDKVLFKVGDFEVTILYFIIFIILIIVFSNVIRR